MVVLDITTSINLIVILGINIMNKEIDSIFERIKDELRDGSFQYYSLSTKSHYLYIGNKLIFIINLNELGPEPSKVGLYVIRYEKAGEVPIESFISSIPLSELEDYIYRVVSSIEDITEINKEYFHLQERE